MVSRAVESLPIAVFAFATVHFCVVLSLGWIAFVIYGFQQPPVSRMVEVVFGVGVHILGFPDTPVGWGTNSILYGLVGGAVLWGLGRLRAVVRHRSDPT